MNAVFGAEVLKGPRFVITMVQYPLPRSPVPTNKKSQIVVVSILFSIITILPLYNPIILI